MDRVYLVNKGHVLAGPDGFSDADEAFAMLQRAALDFDNLQHFRDIWFDALNGSGYQPPTDKRVLRTLAERLAIGVLRVARKRRPDPEPVHRAPGGGTAAPPPPVDDPAPVRPGPPPLKLRAPTLPPEIAKVVDPVVDFAQQAACLVDAARDGLPFVEQSAKP